MKVIKRDGRLVDFDPSKIRKAIQLAFYSINEEIKEKELEEIVDLACRSVEIKRSDIDIEFIQDMVEESLIRLGHEEAFKEYMTYRRKRAISRERFGVANSKLLKSLESITGTSAKNVDDKRENANVDGDTAMGSMLQYGSTISKEYALSYLVSKEARELHESGDIHIHDLDFYPTGTTTCLQIDLDKLFKGGFSTGHGHLREPQSIGAYASLAAIAIQANQNDQHEI